MASRALAVDGHPRRRSSTLHTERRFTVPKRQEIDFPKSKSYVRRDARGRFTSDQVDVGRSLSADRRTAAHTEVPKGQGDRGDQRRSTRS